MTSETRNMLLLNEEIERLKEHLKTSDYIVERYEAGIRAHRDARGDDRCWRDDVALYQLLPEGYVAPALDSVVELERCKAFISSRQNPATDYVSPQRRIEALEGPPKTIKPPFSPPGQGQPMPGYGPFKCRYCGRYGQPGSCEGCGAPNAPAPRAAPAPPAFPNVLRCEGRIDVTVFGRAACELVSFPENRIVKG